MSNAESLYLGCPVQHARQFIAGKWQMGILWNLRNQALGFTEFKQLLPGISDKILTEELDFFGEKKMIERINTDFPVTKPSYQLTATGKSLIPLITNIVEWGYANLQEEHVNKTMSMTPMPAIEAIEQ
ncbi:MAG: helix-turn-helix transcriptional regulator [Ferruginibacter sp.]|nr:helix-turn-helix transcriptional regulator [Ferruginibacter sp.]